MNSYRYRALNKKGHIENGNYECEDIKKLLHYLKQKELLLVKAVDVSKRYRLRKFLESKAMSNKQLSLFCRQVSSVLDSGMPLVEAFTIISDNYKGSLKQNIVKITSGLTRGETLYNSMQNCGNMFPHFMLEMVSIGEYSGKLDKIFFELSVHFYKQYKLKQKVVNASIYPIIVLVMSQIAVLFLMTTIIPSMMELIRSSGGHVPLLTQIMFSLSNFISNNLIVIIVVTIILSIYCIKIIKDNKLDVYAISRHVKLLSKINKKINSYNILRAIELVYGSGGSIVHAVECSSDIICSNYIKKQISSAVFSIKKGMTINSSLGEIEVMDQITMALIKLGEGTGKLDDMLQKAISILEEDVDMYINKFSELIQPVSILFLAVIVATIMLSVMIPMFTLYNTI